MGLHKPRNVISRPLYLFILRLCFTSCPLFSFENNGHHNYNPSIYQDYDPIFLPPFILCVLILYIEFYRNFIVVYFLHIACCYVCLCCGSLSIPFSFRLIVVVFIAFPYYLK